MICLPLEDQTSFICCVMPLLYLQVTMLELCGTELSTFNGLGLVVDVDIKGFTDKEREDVINTMGSFTGPYPQCTTYRKALIIASDDKLRSVMLWFDPAVFQNQKMYHLGEKRSSIFKDLGIDGRVSVRELASVDFGS